MLKYYEKQNILKKDTIVGRFIETAEKYPEKIAIYAVDGEITYKNLAEKVRVYAGGLVANGICHGEHVLLHISNSIMYVVSLLGTMFAGATPIPLLQEHHQTEIISIGKELKVSAIIVKKKDMNFEWENMISTSVKEIPSLQLIVSDKTINGIEKIKSITEEELLQYRSLEKMVCEYNDVGIFLLSGGTTGKPKIIPKIHEAYIYNVEMCCQRSGFTDKTIFLTPLSISHDFGLAQPGVLGTLISGGTAVLPETPFFDESFELIEKYCVNTVTLVPALAALWLEGLELCKENLSSWKLLIIGSAKLERNLAITLSERLGVIIQNGYGLGEGITCFTSLDDDIETSINSQGTPISEYDEIKIVDSNGCLVPVGESGELLEKGPYTFGGYYDNEQLNLEVFTKDGFFKTGDKAKSDEKGNITILGRVREQINRAGENVIPSEVEEYIIGYPGIENVCVFGVPDELLGEKTVACIITNKEIYRQDICEYMSKQGISHYKFPDVIYKVKKFPYKNIKKIDKKKLKEDFLGGNLNG